MKSIEDIKKDLVDWYSQSMAATTYYRIVIFIFIGAALGFILSALVCYCLGYRL